MIAVSPLALWLALAAFWLSIILNVALILRMYEPMDTPKLDDRVRGAGETP